MKVIFSWLVALGCAVPAFADLPRTTAEATDYKATTRHADVLTFCEALAKQSPVARLEMIGSSGEGRQLPMLILSEPTANPKQAGKPVVLLFGNIHAGEVDGKEALMMLARDIATTAERAILKDIVVLIVPIVNVDGNERLAKGKRPKQAGPEEVGDRENAGGLDLNRDFVKLESPEVRALVKLIRTWNPAVVFDGHTTNGSNHRHTMTYDGPRHPNCGEKRLDFANKFITAAGQRMNAATGFTPFIYGYFSADRTKWETYPATARYGMQYVGLRGAIGVISESYSYAPFPDRVKASLEFARGVCREAAARKDELRKIVAEKASPERIALRTQLVPEAEPRTVLGFEEADGKPTAKHREYSVRVIARVEPTLEVARPFAYLIAPGYPNVVENLQRHGIELSELREDIELDVETYFVQKVEKSPRVFQKHTLNRLEASMKAEPAVIPAGSVLVRTNQPLGTLACLLLEPQSEDGLTTWNFFDEALGENKPFPVRRMMADAPLVTGNVRPLPEERKLNRPFDLNVLFRQGPPLNLAGTPVAGLVWFDDGEHYLQVKSGTQYVVHAKSGRLKPLFDAEKIAASLKSLTNLDEATVKSLSRRTSFTMNPARTGGLIEHQDDYYFAYFDGTPAVRLTTSAAGKELPTFSPDGKHLAFVRAGNLFTSDFATQTEKALTNDGGGAILNGKADWVYEEEIFHRNGHAFWWSPDSKQIAFLRFDDTPVNKFAVVNHMPTRLNVEQVSYPKAGDPNPIVKLGIVQPGDSSNPIARFEDFTDYDTKDFIISRVGWRTDSQAVYCYVQNRIQSWLDLCFVSTNDKTPLIIPANSEPPKPSYTQKILRDSTAAWIDDTGPLTFLPDGSFVFASDRSGFRHLYQYSADGKLLNPVTSGEWEVRQVHKVDPECGWVYFNGTKDGQTGTNLYRARIDGSAIERLTPETGSHQCSVSKTGSYFVDSWSNLSGPNKVALRDGAGKLMRTLDTNPVYSREEYRFGKVEPVEVPLADGFTLWGTITCPPDFDAAKKYPVWLKTYAGPHTQSVTNSWSGGRIDDQVLAKLGIVVFRVDPRSASGKGQQSAWTAYKKLGVQELKDLEESVDWLAKNPWVDTKRIGISGHSYGGYITAYALTHSKKFAAGVSGAPVTDWRLYDSIYTERYMGLPKENAAGYDAGSVVKAAKNLHGRLLLIHGLMDDNVHVQNSVQFINELQRFDKDFEVMVYPQSRHGIMGRHYQRQVINFIARNMGVEGRVPPRE